MIEIIILFIAVFLFIYGIVCIIGNIRNGIYNNEKDKLLIKIIIITTIGLTYILWYCN